MSSNKKLVDLPYPFSLEDALKKNPELKISDLEILREWCEKQAHLPKIPDLLLALFLHCNYYSMEAAKSTIENYYTFRSHVTEIFNDRNPFDKEFRKFLSVGCVFSLPGETVEGYKVIYCQLLQTDPSLYMFVEGCKHLTMFADLMAMRSALCPGYVFVGNTTGLSLGHVGRINPNLLRKLLYYIQEAIPVRVKQIHFLHVPPALEMLINTVKPFVKIEMMNLLRFHSTIDSLMKSIPAESIPCDVGGKASVTTAELQAAQIKELENYSWWFKEDENYQRVDESKRIGKNKIVNELFGMEGTFKKLEID